MHSTSDNQAGDNKDGDNKDDDADGYEDRENEFQNERNSST